MLKDVQAKVEALHAEYGNAVLVHLVHKSKAGNEVERMGHIDKLHPWGITLADVDKGFRSVRYDSVTSFEMA